MATLALLPLWVIVFLADITSSPSSGLSGIDWLSQIDHFGFPLLLIVLLVRKVFVVGSFLEKAEATIVAREATIAAKDAKLEALTESVAHDAFPALAASGQAVKDVTALLTQIAPLAEVLRGLATDLRGDITDVKDVARLLRSFPRTPD